MFNIFRFLKYFILFDFNIKIIHIEIIIYSTNEQRLLLHLVKLLMTDNCKYEYQYMFEIFLIQFLICKT